MVLLIIKCDLPNFMKQGIQKKFDQILFFLTQMRKSRFTVLSQYSSNMCLIRSFTNPQTITYSFCFVLFLSILGIQSLNRCPITTWPGPKTELQVATPKGPSHVTSTLSLFLSLSQNRPPSRALASLGKCAFTCGINPSVFIEPYLLRKKTQNQRNNMGIRNNSNYNPHCPTFVGKANNLVFYPLHFYKLHN